MNTFFFMTSRTQDALGRFQPYTVPGPAAYMLHVATETARRRCALDQPAQMEAPQFFQVVLDQAPPWPTAWSRG